MKKQLRLALKLEHEAQIEKCRGIPSFIDRSACTRIIQGICGAVSASLKLSG